MPLLLALLACGADPAPTPAAPAVAPEGGPVPGDTLVLAIPFDPGNFNPIVAPYALSGYFTENVALGLAARELGPDGVRYAPALAEGWEWSEDGRSLTYTLREGLVWDDGAPITSADAAFTWSLIANPAVASNWHNDTTLVAGVDTPDPRTVIFRFHQPGNPALLQGVSARGLLPQHRLSGVDPSSLRGHDSARAPTASGPWRVASWKPEERVVLEPNPSGSAWPRPWLERVVARVLPEYSTRLLELRSGALDMLTNLELSDVPLVEQDPRLRVIRVPVSSVRYVGWNTRDARLASVEVRRALGQAIDREGIIRSHLTLNGEPWAQLAVSTVAPTLGAWSNTALTPLAYDVQAARAGLAQAGWADTDGDGVLDRGGEPLRLSLLIQSGYPEGERLAVQIQAMLREVGVQLDIQPAEPNRFSALARQHEFEAILWSFGNNPRVDPYLQWHTDGQYNWMQYSDPQTDALLAQVRAATTLEEAQRAAREAQARVFDAHVASFLFWEDTPLAIDRRFQGVEVNSLNLLEHLERWWVPEGLQKY